MGCTLYGSSGRDAIKDCPTASIRTMNASDPAQPRFAPTASPCVQICTLDERKVCIGCGRTVFEIANWARMSAEERHAIMLRLEEQSTDADE